MQDSSRFFKEALELIIWFLDFQRNISLKVLYSLASLAPLNLTLLTSLVSQVHFVLQQF